MHFLRILLLSVIGQFVLAASVSAQDKGLINGTIIITLTSNDTIWMGADTRTSSLTDKGYTVNKEGMCKIYSTGDVIYAMAGHVRYVDNSFNFVELMQKCINEQRDFEKAMTLFQQKAVIEIRSILKRFSRKSINTLIKTDKGSFLTVVAISFVNDERKMKQMTFSVSGVKKNNRNVSYKVNDDNGTGSLKFMGHAENALKYVRSNNLFFGNGRNIPQKINELIELESKSTITVGMPADVISIYNNGYKRVITSGLCEDHR